MKSSANMWPGSLTFLPRDLWSGENPLRSALAFRWATNKSTASWYSSLLVTVASKITLSIISLKAPPALSVGSVLALSSAVLGTLMVDLGWPLWSAIPLCLLTGAACGLASGCVSIAFRIPSFIVTLGMLEMARGATKLVTDSQTKYIGSAVEPIGEPLPGIMLSPAFLLAIASALAGQFFLTRTVFGRYCVAIGTNAEAVRMSGIRTAPYSISVFVISGLLCGMAGLAQTSRLSSADPNAAIGIELSAIAACVIGGTSLMGGRGSVISSFIGVLIIAVLQTGLAQLGVSDANKQIITGAVIVVAVLLDALRSRWKTDST